MCLYSRKKFKMWFLCSLWARYLWQFFSFINSLCVILSKTKGKWPFVLLKINVSSEFRQCFYYKHVEGKKIQWSQRYTFLGGVLTCQYWTVAHPSVHPLGLWKWVFWKTPQHQLKSSGCSDTSRKSSFPERRMLFQGGGDKYLRTQNSKCSLYSLYQMVIIYDNSLIWTQTSVKYNLVKASSILIKDKNKVFIQLSV